MAEIKPRDAIDAVIARRRLRFRFMKHESWENALFVHWPVDPALLASRLPRGLEPHVLEGFAWLGLVLLTERGVSAHGPTARKIVKPIDHYGANVRTYVLRGDKPGIYFFSLECTSLLASIGARAAGIPYYPARMWRSVDIERPLGVGGGKIGYYQQASAPLPCQPYDKEKPDEPEDDNGQFTFEFSSVRVGWRRPSVTARWQLGGSSAGDEGSFLARAQWFTERYSVFAAWPGGLGPLMLRGDVQHPTWPIQPAVLKSLEAQTLFAAAGFPDLGSMDANGVQPHVCFSRGVGPIEFWMLEP